MSEGLAVIEEAATQLCFGREAGGSREVSGSGSDIYPSIEVFPKYNSMAAVTLREPEVALYRGATKSDTHLCEVI